MKIQDICEQSFKNSTELIQNIVDNYNRAGNKNWKAEAVTVDPHPADYAEPKSCFSNAFRYLVNENLDAKYILGYVIVRGVPCEHAWIKDGNRYVDPTLESGEYIKVVELSGSVVVKFAIKNHHAPELIDAMKL